MPESYVTIDLGEAGQVKVAAVDLGGGGLVADRGDFVAPLAKLVGPIEALSRAVMDALKKAEPTSFAVELDFNVGVGSGGLITVFGKVSGSAAVKATLTWNKSAP